MLQFDPGSSLADWFAQRDEPWEQLVTMGPIGSGPYAGSVTWTRTAFAGSSLRPSAGVPGWWDEDPPRTVSTRCGTDPSAACTATRRQARRRGSQRVSSAVRSSASPGPSYPRPGRRGTGGCGCPVRRARSCHHAEWYV